MKARKVKYDVPEGITVGGTRYHSGEQPVAAEHAVTLEMLQGKSKAEAMQAVRDMETLEGPEPEAEEAESPETEETTELTEEDTSEPDTDESEEGEAPAEDEAEEAALTVEDVPHADEFVDAGLDLDGVLKLHEESELQSVNGIGPKSEADVQEWINANLSDSEG